MANLIYKDLSYKIIGILMNIHNELGCECSEKHYHKAIEVALKSAGLKFDRERPIELKFSDTKIGNYFLDFVIEDKIILEIKVLRGMHSKFITQLVNYLKTSNLKLGILVNFGKEKLEYKRIIN